MFFCKFDKIFKQSFFIGPSWAETAVCRDPSKEVFLKILQYSQENTWVGVSF